MPGQVDQTRRMLLSAATLAIPTLASGSVFSMDSKSVPITQPGQADDESFIQRAFEMRGVAIDSGDQAYGACVVLDEVIVGQSPSLVVLHRDPTAHAEMQAIRDAAARLGRRDLSDCTLYSSSQACPMCAAAAYWANIKRMVYGRQANDGGRPGLC